MRSSIPQDTKMCKSKLITNFARGSVGIKVPKGQQHFQEEDQIQKMRALLVKKRDGVVLRSYAIVCNSIYCVYHLLRTHPSASMTLMTIENGWNGSKYTQNSS